MTDPEDSVDTLEQRAAEAIDSLRAIRGGCSTGPTCKQTCKEDCSG
jgi:hypothetical protein